VLFFLIKTRENNAAVLRNSGIQRDPQSLLARMVQRLFSTNVKGTFLRFRLSESGEGRIRNGAEAATRRYSGLSSQWCGPQRGREVRKFDLKLRYVDQRRLPDTDSRKSVLSLTE
jgi:hypothetical protein